MNVTGLLVVASLLVGATTAQGTVVVSAERIEKMGATYQLKMSVWNCSENAIQVDASGLPWGRNAIGVVLQMGGPMPGNTYVAGPPIRDMSTNMVTLAPHKSLSGAVDLSSYFEALEKFKTDRNTVIFWTYNMSRIVASDDRQVGGMVLLHPASTVPGNPKSPYGPSSP